MGPDTHAHLDDARVVSEGSGTEDWNPEVWLQSIVSRVIQQRPCVKGVLSPSCSQTRLGTGAPGERGEQQECTQVLTPESPKYEVKKRRNDQRASQEPSSMSTLSCLCGDQGGSELTDELAAADLRGLEGALRWPPSQ